jgi:hypothetical protein
MNIVLHKTKLNSLEDTVADRLYNSTGNQPGVIAHLELFIEVLQFFFIF